MDNVQLLKDKLAQKRNRLAAEEIRINLKERKLRTRRLIEIGGLVDKQLGPKGPSFWSTTSRIVQAAYVSFL